MKERKLGLIGRKLGMTQVFDAEGKAHGVTVIELGPCKILAIRSSEKNKAGRTDGYCALQLGFALKPSRKINSAEAGHLKAAGGNDSARRFIYEMRIPLSMAEKFEVGQDLTLQDLELKIGEPVDVMGTSKGKGFQGVMRRHNFHGAPASRAHESFRHGGSIGCRKFPGRVFRGQKMPGQQGNARVTVQNVKIQDIRTEDNVILLKGGVPGAVNSIITIRPAIKLNPVAA